jgi:GT2 family glycosyltransferase
MGALIGMAVYSTEENQKDDCLDKTLWSLAQTVDFEKHQLILSINAFTDLTKSIISNYGHMISKVIWNDGNIGTAEAINKCWKERRPGQHCIKMDDDVVIHSPSWIDTMIEAINRDNKIGQIGLKRKDCWEYPYHENPDFRSEMHMLAHDAGNPWIIIEKVKHVIGTCVMHSSDLLDKVGYLRQPSQYGYDDVLMSHRANIAGFISCFLPHIEIDHIDDGQTPYQDWKHKHSGEQTQAVIDLTHRMYRGEEPIYYNPFQS